MFTTGAQITTSLTNVIIMIISFYAYLNLNKKDLWSRFFLHVSVAGLLGSIIHGINFNDNIIDILWLILLIIFSIIINNLMCISFMDILKISKKQYLKINILSTIFLYIALFLMAILKIDYILYFAIYCGIILLIMLVINMKKILNDINRIYIIIGIVFQIIGGIFLLNKSFYINILVPFDKNGMYHIFMCVTIYMFYLYNKKK